MFGHQCGLVEQVTRGLSYVHMDNRFIGRSRLVLLILSG